MTDKPTGRLRFIRPRKVVGDLLSQTKLQQEWDVFDWEQGPFLCWYSPAHHWAEVGRWRSHSVWRDVPVIVEEAAKGDKPKADAGENLPPIPRHLPGEYAGFTYEDASRRALNIVKRAAKYGQTVVAADHLAELAAIMRRDMEA